MRKLIISVLLLPAIALGKQGPKEESWSQKMQELSKTLSRLIPVAFDNDKISDPQALEQMKKDVKILKDLAHSIDQSKTKSVAAPDSDPAIKMLSQELSSELQRALQSLQSGDVGYAKFSLRTSMSYCISCHTRSDFGPKFPKLDFGDSFAKLSPSDRLNLYSATRQYDLALGEFNSAVENAVQLKINSFALQKITRTALAIAVRVKQDPELALKLLARVEALPETSEGLNSDIKTWRSEVLKWKEEKTPPRKTEVDRLANARKLVGEAKKAQHYPMDAKGDIDYMRASALLHDFIRDFPKSSKIAEAYYLAGLTYSVLRDIGFWSLHEQYFESCIDAAPHSDQAKLCYAQLKDSVFSGYTGSRGTDVPSNVKKYLKDYEAKATKKP